MGFLSASFFPFSFATTSTARRPFLHHHCRFHFRPAGSSLLRLSPPRKCSLNSWISSRRNTACRVSCGLLEVEDDEACELVSGIELSIGDGDDSSSINAYLLKAVKNNNGNGILLLSDIFGFMYQRFCVSCCLSWLQSTLWLDHPELQLSGIHCSVLVPDLFRGDPWTKDRPMTMLEEWIAKQEPQRVAEDIDISAKWMVDEFAAAGISKKLGIIGFCFGGGRVMEVLSRDQGAYFGIGVSFYGTRMDPSLASTIKVPVLLISGDKDPLCAVSILEDIEKNVVTGSKLVIFEGRGHGFAHRPNSPEEDTDAEKAFTIMRNWLHEGLVISK